MGSPPAYSPAVNTEKKGARIAFETKVDEPDDRNE